MHANDNARSSDRLTAPVVLIYSRDADRQGAQNAILEAAQKRFENIDWKTPSENASKAAAAKPAKSLKK